MQRDAEQTEWSYEAI